MPLVYIYLIVYQMTYALTFSEGEAWVELLCVHLCWTLVELWMTQRKEGGE